MILRNIGTLARCLSSGGQSELHLLHNAAVVWREASISWVGSEDEIPKHFRDDPSLDAQRALVIPGLVDCHTHLAFGGWRADEFEQRMLGVTYQEIAANGGGILSTVRATRNESEEALYKRAYRTLDEMITLGVTTVECKSGYGLTLEDELKLLQVYRRLREDHPCDIVSTFLGAHTIPLEYRENRSEYVRRICEDMIPEVAERGLADFCDVFLEKGAFSYEEAEMILREGIRYDLTPKIHADQMSNGRGAHLAAHLHAASADHLEYVDEEGISALAESKVIAVALPFATLYTKGPPLPARALIDAGVRVAVATDFNPGTAPSFHLPMALLLSCTLYGLTPHEALKGATSFAAAALGREDLGSVSVGKAADLAIIDAESVNQWLYHLRPNACVGTIKHGRVVYQAEGWLQ